ncbi:hypothetical protein [Ornithinibacillus halotolerans]|uniref:Uncharacterized protein n=1 Tax=Ornithinibacillus halotolerans TaxID=1274357 RepID=A0A916WBB9_9BACI|nr:hypothetical protein [Ornithinibacillus halotolerans]GGA82555.1 hypothetical protein GCM10008025_27180 [Ornithinibacillus halotolerans]
MEKDKRVINIDLNPKESNNKNVPKKFETIEIGDSSGFFCDVNTGVCGPIKKKEEGN